MAQQCNRSAECWRRGMLPSATEEVVVVVETLSLDVFNVFDVGKPIQVFD